MIHRSLSLTVCFLFGSVATAQPDDSYRRLAEALASPVFFDASEARQGHKDDVVMMRTEIARQRLMAITTITSDLATLHSDMVGKLQRCNWSLENQRRLDNSVPDIEGLVSKTLTASPGLYKVYKKETSNLSEIENRALAEFAVKAASEAFQTISDAYEASEERSRYRTLYREIRSEARDRIRKVAGSRYRVPKANSPMLSVDLQGSLNAYFNSDWLVLHNSSGEDLTDCTLFVDLHGWHGKDDRYFTRGDSHMHFVPRWPKDQMLICPYPSTSGASIASNQSIDVIDKIDIYTMSNEMSEVINYEYNGANYDSDLEKQLAKIDPKFSGSWYRYDTNYFLDDGFYCYFEGDGTIPAASVTMRLPVGFTDFRWTLDGGFFPGKSNAKTFRDSSFNTAGVPRSVELIFHFPHSEFKHRVEWTDLRVNK